MVLRQNLKRAKEILLSGRIWFHIKPLHIARVPRVLYL